MKEIWKKLPLCAIIFIGVLILSGAALMLLGLRYQEPNPANPDDDALFMNMLFTIPGLVLIIDSFFCLRYDNYRKKWKYLLHNFLLFFLGCLIIECIYFQLIYFGVNEPQYKMIVPSLLISLIYALLSLAVGGIYLLIRKKIRRA